MINDLKSLVSQIEKKPEAQRGARSCPRSHSPAADLIGARDWSWEVGGRQG